MLDALVDAVLARRVRCAFFVGEWELSPACVPALARLLGGDALEELILSCDAEDDELLDEPAAALLGAALRANTTLTHLGLNRALGDTAAAARLLRALKAHPSLRKLDLRENEFYGDGIVRLGRRLGALLAANAPALTELDVCSCRLGDEGLGPLVNALRGNTHLRVLDCINNGMSGAFAHDRLLPAVRANRCLRRLTAAIPADSYDPPDDEVLAAEEARVRELQTEAEALVAARRSNSDSNTDDSGSGSDSDSDT